MIKKLIVFDFDGVLANSFDTFYSLIRDAMNHAGLSFTQDQYRNFFIGNVHQGIKDFTKEKYSMVMKFRNSNYDKYYDNKRHRVKLFPEAPKFLKKIGKNYILTVASSGRTNNIIDLLERNRIKNLFSLVMANSANSKADMIKKILNKFHSKPEETLMITDTVGDIKVAKKIGLATIAVSWGFHSAKTLESEKPDYLANNFKELYKKIKAF